MNKLKIAHICLGSSFTENLNYQDNLLAKQDRKNGHEVLIIADRTHLRNGIPCKASPEEKFLDDGARLIRIELFAEKISMALGNLLHWSPKIKGILDTFKPDVIFHHGINGFSLISASRYIDRNPGTRLYVDCHTDVHNCKHNGLILYFQHNFLYRLLWQISKSNIKRTFYISHEVRDFLLNHYRIKQQHIEFLPLGGNLIPLDKKLHHKHAIRNRLDLPRDSIIFVHAGKLNKSKKTIELLSSFMQCSNPKYRLLIAGTIDPSIDKQFTLAANKDRRIIFLGWKSGDELIELLCAADCYVQPGTQSVTLQTALCCGTPVIVHPYKSHFEYVKSNGYFVENPEDLYAAMLKFNDPISIKKMENESYKIAHDLLDVSRQSLKYTETE